MWEHHIKLEYDIERTCRCLSCYCFRISWDDVDDKPQYVESDSLNETIDRAWHKIVGVGRLS